MSLLRVVGKKKKKAPSLAKIEFIQKARELVRLFVWFFLPLYRKIIVFLCVFFRGRSGQSTGDGVRAWDAVYIK